MHTLRLAIPALVLLTPTLSAQLTWQKAAQQPTARSGHLAFFDAPRGRITVFGGQDSPTGRASDCWQFDQGWVRMDLPAFTPFAYGACADDPLLPGTAVVFGGTDSGGNLVPGTRRWNRELHRFDTLSPAATPPLRWITGMATDTARQRTVLFGGGDTGGPLGDTWEWDGSNWQQRLPAQSPPMRANHCMAFDNVYNRVLMFGGHNGASRNDTWAFDGTSWTDVSGSFRPSAVHNAMMACDVNRNLVVLFGGKNDSGTLNNSYWLWSNHVWTGPVSLTVRPPARELASFTYDSRRKKLVLVGGVDQSGALLNDVWELDSGGWIQRSPLPPTTAAPGFERSNHAAAYASNRGRMVVFGGNHVNSTAVYLDTSETNGSAWAVRPTSPQPLGRTGAKMAFDHHNGRCYLFGGRGISTFTDNAVWHWDGLTWTSIPNPSASPFGRTGHALVYDGNRRRLVMFGGNHQFGTNNETWEFDPQSATWAQRSPAQSPSARAGHAMAYSDTGFSSYLFGGALAAGGYSDELWTWNGTNWALLSPANRPPQMANAAMCNDPVRGRLVLFGGGNQAGVNTEVYEFDGLAWHLRSLALQAARPQGRVGASLVWDSKNRRSVLYGGNDGTQYFNDVWEWSGSSWTQRPHAGVPEPRAEHTLSHDPVRNRTVLFGGIDGNRTFDDTWEWNGSTWTPKVTVNLPPARWALATAFEQSTGRTVLFGGVNDLGSPQSGTFLFDGTDWMTALVTSPPARNNHAMASLSPAAGVILYGGHNGATPLSDAWIWNGSSWAALPAGPGPRDIHAMAYDSVRGRLVGFGGRNPAGQYLTDTFELVLATMAWVQRSPVQNPPARWNHAMTFDASRGRVVMSGGHNGVQGLDDLWEWDGSNWLQRTPETSRPAGPWNSGLAYDRARGRCVAFGGNTNNGLSNELWEYSAVIDLAGRGNTANPSAMRYYTQPKLGEPLKLGFTLPQNVGFYVLGFGPSQAPQASLGAPPLCEPGNVYATLVTYLVVGSSEPNFSWTVPNTPLIQGVTLVFQGASVVGSCFRASDALHVQFR